ncbi:urease subunit beta [Scopulibacillus cellulosilyticus]|uniref:Urease subunit beta n=1 Tax=Scopulibacillus cellulosilyticus TaxID=2665665 RepID=A0ABW2PX77_9BACL
MIPGEVIYGKGDIVCNEGRETIELSVTNTGDRPVQVGSHFHFFEVNRQLEFDRKKAFGYRLDIVAGSSTRFEPGEQMTVQLVALAGKRRVYGLNQLTNGSTKNPYQLTKAMERAARLGFKTKDSK